MKSLSKRMRCCCCTGCGVFALVPLLLFVLLMTPPPRPKPLTTAEKAVAVQKAEAVRKEIKAVAKDLQAGKSRDFRLELGEAEVNEMLLADPDLQPILTKMQLRDPFVVMDGGSIHMTATRNAGGVDVATTVSVTPRLGSDNKLGVSVDSAHVGRLRVPDTMTRRFADRLAAEISQRANSGKVRLKSVRVEPGQMVVEGSTK